MSRQEETITWQTTVGAWSQLRNQGWTTIPDSPSMRTQVTKGLEGKYVSYFDPELQVLVIVLHSEIRERLGL